MNFSTLKELVKKNNDRFVLMENDEPEIVMLSFREYARITDNKMDKNAMPPLRNDMMRRSVTTPSAMPAGVLNADANRKRNSDSRAQFINAELDVHREMPEDGDARPQEDERGLNDARPKGLPLRLEDLRLEDLPF
ncbi:MAG: hypothetical protein AAB539_03390 [Patescibacteria group bacterium]